MATTVESKLREFVSVKDFGAVGDGVTDDTSAIQAALDSGAKFITAPSGLTFKTTNTLFVTSNNTVIDFNGSKIDNKANSRYAICLVTSVIGVKSEANLTKVMESLNYGSEIFNSHIKNVVVEMSTTSSGGSNLGVGIVYGKNCSISNVVVTQTNGNGIEVRNSTSCIVDKVNLKVRSYGAFFFMTKDCAMTDSYITGCARGIITKMSQAGAPVNFKAARCVVENLSDGLYYAVGGEWKERTLTYPIYQSGHENVTDVTYEDCTFKSSTGQVKVDASYFASRFTYKGCVFYSEVGAAGANIGLNGNQIGESQGKNHKFIGCTFVNSGTVGNAAISTGANTLISGCVFAGSYQRLLIASQGYSPTVAFTGNLIQGNLQTIADSANCLLVQQAGAILEARNNVINMTLGFSGSGTDSSSGVASFLSVFSGNTVRITGSSSYSQTTVYVADGVCYGNNIYYSDFGGNVYSILVTNAAKVQNNVIGNNGTIGAGSRAVFLQSSSIEVVRNEGNCVSGAWEYQQYAILSQNYQYSRRLKTWSVAPTVGTWAQGDVVFNSTPSAGGVLGWVCVAAGTPGTWVPFGGIQTGIAYTVTNGSTDRDLNVSVDTLAQVAAVLGTLITDLKASGVLK